MSNIAPTDSEKVLSKALNDLGIETKSQHWDGHKHIDIYIPAGKIYIEVDELAHLTNVKQIMSDFQRDHYSDDAGFHTLRIPSETISEHVNLIAGAIARYLDSVATP
jgi:very-short-patch-repair endonuclease